jgi:hypothetical protein
MLKYSSLSYAIDDAGRVLDMNVQELDYGKEILTNFLHMEPELIKYASVGDLICRTVVAQNFLPIVTDPNTALRFLHELNSCLNGLV